MRKKRDSGGPIEKKGSSFNNCRVANTIILILAVILVLAVVTGTGTDQDDTDEWTVSGEGILSYKQREGTDFILENITHTDDTDILKQVRFNSHNTQIEGILRIPDTENKVRGVVVLPGAGVSKEAQSAVPEMLSGMGYASITIDQRNLGVIDPEHDLGLFKGGSEPLEYIMVYDAMMAADVLDEQPEVDGGIAMLGLSNGGRFAIITTAIEPGTKGVIAISTCGYDTVSIDRDMINDEKACTFYRSIDPDNYLDMIPPRRLVMLHSVNDSIIPFELAQRTFSQAQQPKELYRIEGSTHGYNKIMGDYIGGELERIFE
ncbi:MAG: alpha/beta hydrolase [Methanosarcinaceae archaeon]|nr:alpha/beta hydrolase [Methanosarcinaceae archaeon]